MLYPALLLLQMAVVRVLGQPGGQLLCDSGPELGGGLFGEGDDQKFVDGALPVAAEDLAHKALDNNLRLAGARGGGH